MVSEHRAAVEELAERAEDHLGDALRELVLYGSVARGEETAASDVDVFAVVETEEQKRWLQQEGAEIGVEHGVLLVPIVKTVEEYEEMQDTLFGQEIQETGVAYV
ncbi:MAG: nucleotidyltransferase domain-containing protein [Candidatus Nanohaloarchaea archaeon]|nr:nucleotidyltransferase domain-containing protein [Candidatus Nanohaloarchaea archaeon]